MAHCAAMPESAPFAAALLVGGRSRRMGQDKALLPWPVLPLWTVQLEKLRRLQPQCLLVAGRVEQQMKWDHPFQWITDPVDEDAGPLPAIIRCVKQSQMRTLVLAVDMPDITEQVLLRLLASSSSEQGAVYQVADQLEPLAAVFTPAMLPSLEMEAAGRGSVHEALRRAIGEGACHSVLADAGAASLFRNMNTPADLMPEERLGSDLKMRITRLQEGKAPAAIEDALAVEEPLEIRVEGRSVAVVMRTPGHDEELAAGFLVSEGVVKQARDIMEISQCPHTGNMKGNVVDVLLGGAVVNWESLTRHVFSASSCGLCGKTSLDSVLQTFDSVTAKCSITPTLLRSLPARLRAAQETFEKTGGLHACAVFDLEGNLVVLREDVGRHNALDKVLGYGLRRGLLPWSAHVLLLSGRVSFEMMQKALAAGIPVVAAISAPTSLAVDFAISSGQSLIGFLRGESMNVYAGKQRVLE
jgi:FdhD protein